LYDRKPKGKAMPSTAREGALHSATVRRAASAGRPVQQTARQGPSLHRILLVLLLAVPVLATVLGLPYYLSPTSERVRSDLHAWLRPSGAVGQSFGLAGLLLFLFMWLYPLRKAFGARRGLGSVGAWMRFHTAVGLSLPLLIAVHAGWRFHGLIGLGYAAMLTVSASGIVGRYLYTRIPRSRSGLELTRDEIATRRRSLVTEIAVALALDPEEVERSLTEAVRPTAGSGLWGTLRRMVVDDFARWAAVRRLRARWSAPRGAARRMDRRVLDRALRLARDEIRYNQQLRLLDATHKVFRYWHVAHRPVSVTALLAVIIHVAVAVAMGQTWLR
jgi:hypothetical protein